MLYLITLLAAPWLLREGKHIRVDVVLHAMPARAAYGCEWIADLLGLACCLWLVWYGLAATARSHAGHALSIKTLVMPEWWFLAPLPACFALLAIEFGFRMRRLAASEARPRSDAVSAA
jgi:TRAP-type C4-dicarboxylate transport system permease small subunit